MRDRFFSYFALAMITLATLLYFFGCSRNKSCRDGLIFSYPAGDCVPDTTEADSSSVIVTTPDGSRYIAELPAAVDTPGTERKTVAEMKGMKLMDADKLIKTLDMISSDMENDAEYFDGRPFNGKTVAEYFGYQGAAIAALANITKIIVESAQEKTAKGEVSK